MQAYKHEHSAHRHGDREELVEVLGDTAMQMAHSPDNWFFHLHLEGPSWFNGTTDVWGGWVGVKVIMKYTPCTINYMRSTSKAQLAKVVPSAYNYAAPCISFLGANIQ